ncbi:MAG TPA: hypothetical protein VKU01_16025 [Bryobacteraceae bacterium]|nr:hypothetical protein [Bryobacteraceae bacterium]
MLLRFAVGALVLLSGAAAQDKPQLVWEGDVTGPAVLYVHGKRLTVERQDNALIEKQRYHVYDKLPDVRQDVKLQVTRGRGDVKIVDQPRADNDYTLAVALGGAQAGAASYSLALFWDTGGDALDRAFDRMDSLKWSGRVDGEIVVACHRNECRSQTVEGGPVLHEKYKFSRPLPDREVSLRLEVTDGRGQVKITEQPNERNGYVTRIVVRDRQGGYGDYGFVLAWDRSARREPPLAQVRLGMVWSGIVTDTVRVTVQDGSAFSQVVKGPAVGGEHAVFERTLPGTTFTPELKKRQGRGEVALIESPSSGNGYRLVFEIRNAGDGADHYEVEVDW